MSGSYRTASLGVDSFSNTAADEQRPRLFDFLPSLYCLGGIGPEFRTLDLDAIAKEMGN